METLTSAVNLLKDKLTGWIQQAVLMLPNFLIALILLSIAYAIATLTARAVKNLLARVLKNRSLVSFLATMARISVMLVGLMIALEVLQLDQAVTSLLAGVGILGIVLGFAFQDMASNFFSGVALVFQHDRPFKVGDIVESQGQIGVIKEINLRSSVLETFTGQWIFVPNAQVFQSPLVNYSMMGKRRIDLEVGISYGDDLEKAKRVTLQTIRALENVEKETANLFYDAFGDSSINFVVQFWIPFKKWADYLSAKDNAIMAIKNAYDQHDITIPFPIRTLDFGIKGSVPMKEMLER